MRVIVSMESRKTKNIQLNDNGKMYYRFKQLHIYKVMKIRRSSSIASVNIIATAAAELEISKSEYSKFELYLSVSTLGK